MKEFSPREQRTLSKNQLRILRDGAKGVDLTGAYSIGPSTHRDMMPLFDAGLLASGGKITDLGRAAIKTGTYRYRGEFYFNTQTYQFELMKHG